MVCNGSVVADMRAWATRAPAKAAASCKVTFVESREFRATNRRREHGSTAEVHVPEYLPGSARVAYGGSEAVERRARDVLRGLGITPGRFDRTCLNRGIKAGNGLVITFDDYVDRTHSRMMVLATTTADMHKRDDPLSWEWVTNPLLAKTACGVLYYVERDRTLRAEWGE